MAPVRDIEALAAAVVRLLRDPTDAKRMGDAGRAHVLSAYPKRKLAERCLDAVRGQDAMPPAAANVVGRAS